MCMLTGLYPQRKLLSWERKIASLLITELLLRNCDSGNRDAVGLATIDGDICKRAAPADSFCLTPDYNNWVRANVPPLIGHVRTISAGTSAVEGAHPFRVGHIVLAHNGTFTNYRELMKEVEVKDKNPVDSLVITAMLAKEAGTNPLTEGHLQAVLKKIRGNYTLLIADTQTRSFWIATGSCPLFIQQQGPLFVVNTSEVNMKRVSYLMEGMADLLFGKEFLVKKPNRIPTFSIHKLGSDGLQLVAELPKPVVAATLVPWNSNSMHTSSLVTGLSLEMEEIAARALARLALTQQEGVTESEIRLATHMIFGSHWSEVPASRLDILRKTFDEIFKLKTTEAKRQLWSDIKSRCDGSPYTKVAGITDIEFPWPLNTMEELSRILEILKWSKDDAIVL